MLVAALPVLPLLSVQRDAVGERPVGEDETLMPVTCWVAEETVPLPVTAVPPPLLVTL